MNRPRRIGILTSGGDCPGINAVIRAVTKSCLTEGIEVLGIKDGFLGLLENRMAPLTDEDVAGILTQGGTILGTTNRANPFRLAVEESGRRIWRDVSAKVIENYYRLGLEGLVCVGGDGSMTIAAGFVRRGLNIVGVPKTIDNDLRQTDLTFGFDSAVANAADAIDKIHTTAVSHHRVMVVETMGRYAGWLALTSGLAAGGDVILIPEIPFDLAALCEVVSDRERRGKQFTIVVVAEGAHPAGAKPVVARRVAGSSDPVRLGGIGTWVAEKIETGTGKESRVAVLGHVQRGGSPTAFDRVLATRFGVAACDLLSEGRFGEMVCLKGDSISSVPILDVAGEPRLVPLDHPLVRAARKLGVCFAESRQRACVA
ncbi:MAG: ATP-dependent 6-phosphofructokinase [Pseudomonadota bacterium]